MIAVGTFAIGTPAGNSELVKRLVDGCEDEDVDAERVLRLDCGCLELETGSMTYDVGCVGVLVPSEEPPSLGAIGAADETLVDGWLEVVDEAPVDSGPNDDGGGGGTEEDVFDVVVG